VRLDVVEKVLYEYPILIAAIENGVYPSVTQTITDMPRASGISNTTEKYALILLEKKEKVQRIDFALGKLEAVKRQVIELAYFQEPIYVVDLAAKLNISVRTFYSYRSEALIKIGKILNLF